MNIQLLICAVVFLAIGILIGVKWLIEVVIAAIKDVLEYLKERKELKWM